MFDFKKLNPIIENWNSRIREKPWESNGLKNSASADLN